MAKIQKRKHIGMGRMAMTVVMLMVSLLTRAQITGAVIDAETGDSISFASVMYKQLKQSVISDPFGRYTISQHPGQTLTFSAVGFKPQTVKVTEKTKHLDVKLKPEAKYLDEVMVRSKRSKYSRKENPAVELMRRVIAAKKQTKLENKDYYQYRNYEKLTISLNDISQATLDSGAYARKPWLKNQVEKNPITGKNTLPIIVNEKISRKFYRKDPEKERIYVDAEKSYGVNDLIETGDVFNVVAQEVFTEVDIYDDQMRLLQFPFTSPIGKTAISFYRYYIADTLKMGRDSVIQVSFLPNNQQDFGFRGDLWIIKDSTLQVKKVKLTLPKKSDVNFVRNMQIEQEYMKLPSGEWVLNNNDMLAEISIVGNAGKFLVNRTSRRNDYSFDEIDAKMFRGKALEKHDPYSEMRDNDYWTDNREEALTSGEEGMDDFVSGIKNTKGFGWLITGVKAVVENFVETTKHGNPSKVDIGPINSMISRNEIDGLRLRASAQTTAALNPHLFLKGYVSHGMKSGNTYYGGTLTYSFNKKAYSPQEFPRRNITIGSYYDINSASDKFLDVDKDNAFAAMKWAKVQKMMYYHRHTLDFEREEDWGMSYKGGLKIERNEAVGDWKFERLGERLAEGEHGKYNTTELYVQLQYQPGQSYVNLKQRRREINRDAPIFTLKHTMGIKGFMGGDYDYHVTEASIYKRLWLNSWGKMDFFVKAAKQWNQVPFTLLLTPAANLSYIEQPRTFVLINNMEFLNDQYVSLNYEWDLNGKILNRIPLLKKLQFREHLGFNIFYGGLSDKNNPYVTHDSKLFHFPEGGYVMDTHNPYMEMRAGIHNIFKFLSVEYVRRLNYLDLPTANKHGVRFGFRMSF